MKDARGDVLYVGKAQSLRNRVRSYWQKQAPAGEIHRIRSVIDRVADVEVTQTDSVSEALLLEANLIKRYRPRFNVRLKDDKSYPYIKVTLADDFPRVERTRKLVNDGSRYFGPYASASSVDESMNLVRRLFPFRTCTIDIRDGERALQRPCLLYHIKRCQGPCIEAISKDDYRADIEQVELFLEGRQETLVKALRREMAGAAERTEYERARRAARQDPGHRADDGEPEDGGLRPDRARPRRSRPPGQPGRRPAVRDPRRRSSSDATCSSSRRPARRPTTRSSAASSSSTTSGPASIPREVYVPTEIPGGRDLEAFLAERRGGPVHLRVPQRGEKRELLALATRNAGETLAREQARWLADQGKTLQALEELAEALNLPGAAAPHRVLRHQQLPGQRIGRQHGRLRGRQAALRRVPAVPDQDGRRARTTSPATRRSSVGGSASPGPATRARRRRAAGRCRTSSSSTAGAAR